jgi:K+-transporting ATPase ATPase B chain
MTTTDTPRTDASPDPDPAGDTGTGAETRPDRGGAFGAAQLVAALPGALRKLDPREMWHNPVMFIVEVGAAYTTILAVAGLFTGPETSGGSPVPGSFTAAIAVWLWLTVVFANLAESVAEGRGKAQAETLRATRTSTTARRVTAYDAVSDGGAERASLESVSSADLTLGDVVVVTAGEVVPGTTSPATATSSGASPASTSRPSPASPRPSSASRAATAAP